jgi:hypothetical protein
MDGWPDGLDDSTYHLPSDVEPFGSEFGLWAHHADGTVEPLWCRNDLSQCAFPSDIYASVSPAMGVTADGRLFSALPIASATPSDRWLLVGNQPGYAALDSRHRLHIQGWTQGYAEMTLRSPPEALIGIRYRGEHTACVLSEDGELACEGGGPWTFEFREGPWRHLQASRNMACAQRITDDVVHCLDNRQFDWGPLLDLMVMPNFEDAETALVCGLTVDHRIRCDEETTPPDLLERFDAMNAALDLQDRLAGVPVW